MKVSEDYEKETKYVMSFELSQEEQNRFIDIYNIFCPEDKKNEMKIDWAINYSLKEALNDESLIKEVTEDYKQSNEV